MEHLTKMRTRFQLGQIVVWKDKDNVHKGEIVGLHDDFIVIRKNILIFSTNTTHRVRFEDIVNVFNKT